MLPRYQPQSQLKIFEEILDLESHKPVNISIIDDLILVKLEAKDKSATCPRCGCKSHKLHQNHEHLVQDLPWNEKAVYLQKILVSLNATNVVSHSQKRWRLNRSGELIPRDLP
jgi:hypothetical protein